MSVTMQVFCLIGVRLNYQFRYSWKLQFGAESLQISASNLDEQEVAIHPYINEFLFSLYQMPR
ncbi:hypothetical protein Mapa_012325 [Marchantia paleacea]|nr:hypothetical protein Mapa_012325 [Marchantia paleacea]